MKELIYKINHEENFDKKCGMLEILNMMTGSKYGLFGGRVVRFDNPDGSVAERYAHAHDVWVEL